MKVFTGVILVVTLLAGCSSGKSSSFACSHVQQVIDNARASAETYGGMDPALAGSSYLSEVPVLQPLVDSSSGSVRSALVGLQAAYRSVSAGEYGSETIQRVASAEVKVEDACGLPE